MNALNNKDILMKRVIQLSCLTMMMTRNLTTVSLATVSKETGKSRMKER